MKRDHSCPKCGGHRIRKVRDVASSVSDRSEKGSAQERFDAFVCELCQYSELYLDISHHFKEQNVIHLESKAEDYEEWGVRSDPETEELYESDLAGEELDITEISRVSKRPRELTKAKVVLVQAGARVRDLISILRDTLGLNYPTEADLLRALPLTILDNMSMESAMGLKKLIEDAGGVAEIRSKTT